MLFKTLKLILIQIDRCLNLKCGDFVNTKLNNLL
jgi:hypothetical protein